MGWTAESGAASPVAAILGWLGSINLVLAVFNLVPGYPLDGGRVLRAILMGLYGDADRATRHAAGVGQFVAGLLIVVGLMRFFAGAGAGGLWLAFIGWFLLNAARAGYAEVALTASLRGIRTGDVMARDCDTVSADTVLSEFVDVLLRTGRRCFVVTGTGDRIVGLITPQEVREVDKSRWPDTRVADAMRPLDGVRTITPGTPVAEALRIMAREDVNQVPVVTDGHVDGVITRTHVLRLLQMRAELKL
jgi:CBS domain-containing protein